MPKLPSVSAKKLVKALKKIGFSVVSQKGSHIKLVKSTDNNKITIIIPNHQTIKSGTLRNGILKNIPLTIQGLIDLL